MEYYRYFEFFLSIEDNLADYMRHLQFSEKTEKLFSSKISLLLLQTCPVIESYMAQLCISSETVKRHPLYSWQHAYKLWDSEKGKIKESKGKRSIRNFPKFSYVTEKVFGISSDSCRIFYSERFQNLSGSSHYKDINPYSGLSGFVDFNKAKIMANKQFPTGIETPKWWTAYNKIKHDLDEAAKRVTYQTVIEALGGLFVLLAYCDTDFETLENNGYINGGRIRTRLFEATAQQLDSMY
jgi:hypothetical protein